MNDIDIYNTDLYVVFKVNMVNGERHMVMMQSPDNILVPLAYSTSGYWKLKSVLPQIQTLADEYQSCFEIVKFKQSEVIQLISPQKTNKKELES